MIINKVVGIFSSFKLSVKILFLVLFCMILPFGIVLWILFNSLIYTSKDIEKKSLEETTHLLQQDLLNNVATKATIYDLTMKQMIVGLDDLKETIVEDGFDQGILANFLYHYQSLRAIYYIDFRHRLSIFSQTEVIKAKKIPPNELEKINFTSFAKGDVFSGQWKGPYQDFKGSKINIISYVLPIFKEGEFLGVIGIDIEPDTLFKEIVHIDPSQSSYVFIVRSTGEYITSSERIYNDFQLDRNSSAPLFKSDSINEYGISEILPSTGKKDGVIEISPNGRTKILAYSIIPSFQAKYFVVSPINEIIQVQTEKAQLLQKAVEKASRRGVLQMSVLGLFVVTSSIFFLQIWIIRPLKKLQNSATKIEKGDLDVNIEIYSRDEIGVLATVLHQMVDRLKKKIKEVEEKANALKKANTEISQGWIALQEEKARLMASINSLPSGFILIDKSGSVITINSSVQKILGKKSHHWTLESIQESLGDSVNLEIMIKKSLQLAKRQGGHVINIGTKFVKIIIVPIIIQHSKRKIGSLLLLEDITEAKILERSKDEFFSIASHELRTPLTAIRGNTAMMQEYGSKLGKKETEAMLQDIHDSSTRLIAIVNDFLDMSSIEQGKMQFKIEEFDLGEVINKIIQDLSSVAKAKNILIKAENVSGRVTADRERVEQIGYNLIGNAINYSEKGEVVITTAKNGSKIETKITDNGRGISEANQALLFHKFQQAESNILTRETTKGTGLGLYISKMIAQGMNGDVELLKSEVGKGSTFVFSLPIAYK